ncbi:MAG TPA: hypothetical protein PK156_51475, partial [Polyangium sp.]|nr:hypothetical protein [Polyangium sp.]
MNELKAQNEDTLQEICTSLTVPASAFGMSYVRAYLGEKASIAGIAIDAGVGLILKVIAACFGLSTSKGGQRVGKFFQDIANGALASWTAALGAELGAKRRIETPAHTSGPMTHEDLAAITAAMSPPNAGAVGSAPDKPASVSAPMDYGHLAAITAAMLVPPPMPQQRATAPAQPLAPQASQPHGNATQAASPTGPQTSPPPALDAQGAPSETPKKPYRFAQSRAAPLPDLAAAFASGGIYPIRDIDQNLQWLSREYSTDKLDEVLRWARTP